MTKAEMVEKLAGMWGGISNRQAADNLDSLVEFVRTTVKKDKVLRIPNPGDLSVALSEKTQGTQPADRGGDHHSSPKQSCL